MTDRQDGGISPATVRNWRRLGKTGSLTSRANKTRSEKITVPAELCPDAKTAAAVREISGRIASCGMSVLTAAASLCLNLLHGRVIPAARGFVASLYAAGFDEDLANAALPDSPDAAAAIYSSLFTDGERNRRGLYYTPRPLAKKMTAAFHGGEFLDPCCGCGVFLTCADTRPEKIHGTDVDECAVMLAKIALYLRFPDADFEPDVRRADFLSDGPARRYDFIATNPPWNSLADGAPKTAVKSGEAFAHIAVKCAGLLADGGCLKLILPRSVLNVAAHGELRRFMFASDDVCVTEIDLTAAKFTGVASKPAVLTLKTGACESTAVISGESCFTVDRRRITSADGYAVPLYCSRDAEIIDKIYSRPHVKLSGTWALGIVTGDNSAAVMRASFDGGEPVLTGGDISPYCVAPPSRYIRFERQKFQQCAPESIYRAPQKLVYRFICDRPVFACDTGGTLTLNSANILIPDTPLYFTLGLLNSSLYRRLWHKINGGVKVLRGGLEKLPVPLVDEADAERLSALAEDACSGDVSAREKIDRLVFEIFDVEPDCLTQ